MINVMFGQNNQFNAQITQDAGEGLGFIVLKREEDATRQPISVPVHGLTPQSADHGRLYGAGEGYSWQSTLRAQANGVWVETTLNVTKPIRINPSMILWLGALDNYDDRQAHTWRQTVLRAPTTNQAGLGGNDLPACYLYDHEQGLATICYFPPESFAWSPHRFYEFTMREVVQYRPTPRYGIGLIPATPETLFEFGEGEHHLRWWFTQMPVDDAPSAWDAQTALINAVTPLLDPVPTVYSDAPSWGVMAEHTLTDLSDDACWVTVAGAIGLRAYVKGSSLAGRDHDRSFELMTQLDVLLPLLHWRNAAGNTNADSTIDRLIAAVHAYLKPGISNYFPNHYPYKSDSTFMDTWYFLENVLIKLPWVAFLTGDEVLKAAFFDSLEGARTLAHQSNYLFPLFAEASDWKMRHSLLNVGVGGLYAAGCVIAYQLSGDASHITEAENALRTMHQLPPHMLTHEPQQLTYAAAAASYLAKQDGTNEYWHLVSRNLVNLSLRMGYWGKDAAVTFYDPRGMIQACASLSYPAYKENVETIYGWSELLQEDRGLLPRNLMAAFANLQRCHNYAFFDHWLPAEYRQGACPYIPYEDLATAEFTHTATFGKELYGAGEVFWSALLFDTFGHVDAPDVLCLSLDVPCLELRSISPDGNRRFLLYNPRTVACEVLLTTTHQTKTVTIPAQTAILESL